jgi:hypothetical protein
VEYDATRGLAKAGSRSALLPRTHEANPPTPGKEKHEMFKSKKDNGRAQRKADAQVAYLVDRVVEQSQEIAALKNDLFEIGLAVYWSHADPHWENDAHVVEVARRLTPSTEDSNPLVAQAEREIWLDICEQEGLCADCGEPLEEHDV